MKSLVISQDKTLIVSLRMAGMEGFYCEDEASLKRAFHEASERNDLGLIVIREDDLSVLKEEVTEVKMHRRLPIITTVPNQGGYRDKNFILKYIHDAMGIQIDR